MKPAMMILVVAVLAACAANGPAASHLERVPTGDWGGPSVNLAVEDAGAHVEFDCAHGTLTRPLSLDAEGRFSVPGTFFREGGPERPGDPGTPVRYSGHTDGQNMQLDVVREDGEKIGSFDLSRGTVTRLRKCK
jgi:hypothetical protein